MVQNLARFVDIATALLLDKVKKQAVRRVLMVAAAGVIVLTRHRCNKILRLIKGLLDWQVVDQRLQELLIELERACLGNLVSCIDSYHGWGRIDSLHKNLTEALRVARAQDDDINVQLLFALQTNQKALLIVLVDQEGELFVLEAKVTGLFSTCLSVKHAMAHENEHTWAFLQNIVEGLEVEHLLLNRQLFVHLFNGFADGVKHDVRLDDLPLRKWNKLTAVIRKAKCIRVCKYDIWTLRRGGDRGDCNVS